MECIQTKKKIVKFLKEKKRKKCEVHLPGERYPKLPGTTTAIKWGKCLNQNEPI